APPSLSGNRSLRLAVVSTAVPPETAGQARVLGHLLGSPPQASCLVLTPNPPFPRDAVPDARFRNYRVLAQRRMAWQEHGWLKERLPKWNALAGLSASVFQRAREIARHLRLFDASILIGCSGDPYDLPACTLVALRHRIPFISYLFDDPIFQWPP